MVVLRAWPGRAHHRPIGAYSTIWRIYAVEERPLCSRDVAYGMPPRLSPPLGPVARRGGGASVAAPPLCFSLASFRGGLFRLAAAVCSWAVEGPGTGVFLVEQRPEKPIALRCPDLRLRPGECGFGARMGSSQGCALAESQVSEVCKGPWGSEVKFELGLLPVPPAGFEPALTAPEAVALSPELRGLKDRSKATSP